MPTTKNDRFDLNLFLMILAGINLGCSFYWALHGSLWFMFYFLYALGVAVYVGWEEGWFDDEAGVE